MCLYFEILKDMGKFLEVNSSLKVTQEEAEIFNKCASVLLSLN